MAKLAVFVLFKNVIHFGDRPFLSPKLVRDQCKNFIRSFQYVLGVVHPHRSNFSVELNRTLISDRHFNDIKNLEKYATKHINWYSRGQKDQVHPYFNYLLLDPRITNELRQRCVRMHMLDVWYTFLRAIFYIGKGKAARPYVHLRQALQLFQKERPNLTLDYAGRVRLARDPKLALILDIWRQQRGVLLLRGFRNIGSDDAHTREAAMIDALGMNHLTNRRQGAYFGVVRREFTIVQRKLLGIILLYKLFKLFMNKKRERELHPEHFIKSRSKYQHAHMSLPLANA
ncbi:ankyrin repeat and LEM domain-containing protein 1 [Scaptodrosophila lebanonensis]|uniref:Ankyrin repeat and LEM domain-containing protein 1 n=1 Tax=Drosophila lebanonensis TaxID=7225 RepID=A0A6J2TB10_DROLE|nr:ankyrin repeat and LEM domain-containing protein 1 [Scaptodrosophila lebanonensis]